MAVVTVRDLSDDAKKLLKAKAKANGRSMEAEARVAIYRHVGESPKKRDVASIVPVKAFVPDDVDWFDADSSEFDLWEASDEPAHRTA